MRVLRSGCVPKVQGKAKCCKDLPRCKKCPVVLSRLAKGGYGKKLDSRTFKIKKDVPKAVLKDARR